jgi:hypothetical protein
MKKRILKLLILVLIFCFQGIKATGSYFADEERINGLAFSAGCWAAPTIPQLVYPGNDYHAVLGSDWLANPYMDWENSTPICPLAATITYQYESYHDAGLTQMAYQSIWLSNSQIPAPGTPDGTYYWHVRAKDQFGHISEFSEPWLLTVNRSVSTPTPTPSEAPVARVVINEVYYQGGSSVEWVELYNAGNVPVDLNGWKIQDNTQTDILSTASLILNPDQFAVVVGTSNSAQVIASGAIKIVLDDTVVGNGLAENDRVILKDGEAVVDTVSWGTDGSAFGTPVTGVETDHSISRKEKGKDTNTVDDWMDTHVGSTPPGPNPGTNPHPPEEGPAVDFTLRSDRHAVSFQVNNIKKFKTISYEITYDANGVEKGISSGSEIDLNNEDSFSRNDLILGTCSSLGEVCVYDWGMTRITLRVLLTLPNEETTEIIKEIAY